MKIAFLTVNMIRGFGVDKVVNEQAKYLSEQGNKVTVYTLNYDATYFNKLKYNIIQVKNIFSKKFIYDIKQQAFDVIIAHSSPFFEVLPEFSKSSITIAYEHGDPFPYLFPLKQQASRYKIKYFKKFFVYPFVHNVVAISNFIKKDIQCFYANVIYNGADHLKDTGNLHIKASHNEKIKLLCITRLGKDEFNYKGLDSFIKFKNLFKQKLNYEFIVAGKGTTEDKNSLEKQGITVYLNISDTELVELYKHCDILISFSKWEGFNLPLAEAQYFGKAAFSLNCCCHSEVTQHTFNSINEMFNKILKLSKQEIKQIGLESKKYISKFTWKNNYNNLEKLITNLYSNNQKVKYRKSIIFKLLIIEYKLKFFLKKFLLKTTNINNYKLLINNLFLNLFNNISKKPNNSILITPLVNKNKYLNNFVSICILTKDRLDLIKPCIDSLLANITSSNFEILIGDTGSIDEKTFDYYNKLKDPIKVIKLNSYNFSANNNTLAAIATGEFLIFLNNDTICLPNWFEQILEPFSNTSIGINGCKLLYPNNTIQHAGIEFCKNGYFMFLGKHKYLGSSKDDNKVNIKKHVPAVTGACLAIRHSLFNNVGGFDEKYKEECQDIDLCLKIRFINYGIIYNPNSEMYHLENSTRTIRELSSDRKYFKHKWKYFIKKNNYFET